MSEELTVMEKVRRALGRTAPMENAPVPPVIDESITRLVHGDAGLAELFVKRATEMKMDVSRVVEGELIDELIHFLRANECKKIAVAGSVVLERVNVLGALSEARFHVKTWAQMTLDELYDGYDCAVTDVKYAVAETGSLVIEPSAAQGRGLSLVPMMHVAIVEHKNLVGDLVDLMEKLSWAEQSRSNIIMITGPSKTADIEMNVVTGVHGPNIVKVFLL